MNTLRQLAARIARQCAVAVACAFNAVCAMQRCCAPPSPRKFEIKFALRRIGIPAGFAVCILVFAGLAANDAQAQTCPTGEAFQNGACAVCPSGQGVFPDGKCYNCNSVDLAILTGGVCTCSEGDDFVLFGSYNTVSCYPQNIANAYAKCASVNYGPSVGNHDQAHRHTCRVPTRDADQSANHLRCYLDNTADTVSPHCTDVFGPDLAIPQKPTDGSAPRYVFNCDPDGDNGLIPATINTIGATACTCPAGQTLQDDVCTCPVGQSLQYGVCIVPGVASCRGLTPATSYDSTAGDCVACPAGQGVLANGTCDACPSGQGVLANGTCGACTGGQEKIDGICKCPAGTGNIPLFGAPVCYQQIVKDASDKCIASKHSLERIVSDRVAPFFACYIKNRNANSDPTSSGQTADVEQCFFPDEIIDSSPTARLCSEVFGPNFAFPQKPPGGQERYVFNCDPDGDNGLIPATINTIGATECTCPAGQSLQYGVCIVPGVESCRGLTPATSYDSTAGACVACISGQGVLANGTCGVCPSGEGIRADSTCGSCPDLQEIVNGFCECPAGFGVVDFNTGSDFDLDFLVCYPKQIADRGRICGDRGYSPSYGPQNSQYSRSFCTIPIKNAASESNGDFPNCVFYDAAGSINSIFCSTVFGPDFAIPQKPTDGSDPRYVFNCDPDGDNGLIPATINTIGATECACAIGGQTLQDDVCACPVGHSPPRRRLRRLPRRTHPTRTAFAPSAPPDTSH